MVRTQIQLTKEQSSALKKMALSRHLSIAELIRQAVDTMIKSGAVIDIEERRKRAIDAAGKFSSGLRDLSTEHDKYLEDAFSKCSS
jgi:hypothetical protein